MSSSAPNSGSFGPQKEVADLLHPTDWTRNLLTDCGHSSRTLTVAFSPAGKRGRPIVVFRADGDAWWLSLGVGGYSWFIAMENGPFIDGLPIKNCDFPVRYVE